MPIPMPYPIYDSYGGTRPNTESENLAIISVILSIYILWFISFFITYILYKKAVKKAERFAFRDWKDGYYGFRYDGVFILFDPLMIIGIISFIIYSLVK